MATDVQLTGVAGDVLGEYTCAAATELELILKPPAVVGIGGKVQLVNTGAAVVKYDLTTTTGGTTGLTIPAFGSIEIELTFAKSVFLYSVAGTTVCVVEE